MSSSASALRDRTLDALPALDSETLDPASFDTLGVAVVRGVVERAEADALAEHWHANRRAQGAARPIENRSNPVEVKQIPAGLENLIRDPRLVDCAAAIFGDDVGVFHHRFVVKDTEAAGAIMLHQDSGYHTGSLDKASFFLALAPVSRANGAMYFHPGTHHFGYLGDAGEINPEVLPDGWPVVCPELAPGDLMIMDSRTWHGSHPYQSGPDRVMTDFIYQRGDDPSSIMTVRGTGWSESFLTDRRHELFVTSRSQKLGRIRAVLDSTTN